MNDHLQTTIRENVLRRIERGVGMRPRAYFIARASAAAAVSLLVLLLSAYVLSFIAFSLHESGEAFLLGFGGRGVQTFFVLFPWDALCIDAALILLLEWLLQGFKFGYRISLLGLFAAVLAASALVAAALSLTPLHQTLLRMADNDDLPVIGEAYERIHDSHHDQGVFRGTITAIDGGRITIAHSDRDRDVDDGTRIIELPSHAAAAFSVGERVFVFGTSASATIQAYGVRRLSPDQ